MVQVFFSSDDFLNFLTSVGRLVSLQHVTKTTSNITGEETLSMGTAANIQAYFVRTNQRWDYDKAGLKELGDGILVSKYADAVQKDDLITVDSSKYRVRERYDVPGTFDIDGSSTAYVYTVCSCYLES